MGSGHIGSHLGYFSQAEHTSPPWDLLCVSRRLFCVLSRLCQVDTAGWMLMLPYVSHRYSRVAVDTAVCQVDTTVDVDTAVCHIDTAGWLLILLCVR